MKRMECLDGLRGVLAVYVMLSHMAPFAVMPGWLAGAMSHGGAAVDVFFILSGMVITRSLEGFGYRAGPFLTARMLRIFPVFLVVFGFALLVEKLDIRFAAMPWITPNGLAWLFWSGGAAADWPARVLAHLTMTHGLFPNGILAHVWVSELGAAWSLSTEWQFYLLAVALARPGSGARLIWLLLALSAVAAFWAIWAPEPWRFSRAFLPNKAHFFALGIASAQLLRVDPPHSGGRRSFLPVLVLAAVLGLCLAHDATGGGHRIGRLAAPLVWSVCLMAELHPDGVLRPLAALLRTRPLLWLGAVSYGLYLVNEPVQRLLGWTLAQLAGGDGAVFTTLWVPLGLLAPVAVAAWLHHAVELPTLAWGRRQRARRTGDVQPATPTA